LDCADLFDEACRPIRSAFLDAVKEATNRFVESARTSPTQDEFDTIRRELTGWFNLAVILALATRRARSMLSARRKKGRRLERVAFETVTLP
jgi:hypothetical protein